MAPQSSIAFVAIGAPEDVGAELRHCLVELDFGVDVITDDSWPSPDQIVHSDMVVCVVPGDSAERERMVSRVARIAGTPRVAVIASADLGAVSGALGRFNEVVTWPCSRAELTFRLNRTLGCRRKPPAGERGRDAELRRRFARFNLIGTSGPFLQFVSLLARVANCDAPVLISGETGTGKELAARAVHYLGARADLPFIPVNCGAIPETLFENELFGHRKGAFTDARQTQLGLVEQAEGGTLFLDEVDALSHKGQVALLRFLQDHQFSPLGSGGLKRADVRIVSATNADLAELCRTGAFRRDLLFRLNIMELHAPPLRHRPGDILLLAEHFTERFSVMHGLPSRPLDPALSAWMQQHEWTGNVRELENLVHRAVLTSDGSWITLAALEAHGGGAAGEQRSLLDVGFNEAKAKVIEQFERNYLSRLLSEADGNVTRAAALAGKERRSLGKLLKKHNIRGSRNPGRG